MTEEVTETWEERVTKKLNELGDIFEERLPGAGAVLTAQIQTFVALSKVQTSTTAPIE